MGRSEKNETKAYIRLVLGTLLVIGLLTAANGLIILNHLGTNVFKPLQRNIAAVTTVPEVVTEEIESPVINIDCQKTVDVLRFSTKASSARIFFQNCQSIGRLINESNQNQGDVFPLKGNQWTSDFIFLKEGKNSIKAPVGKTTQLIEITRESSKESTSNKAL